MMKRYLELSSKISISLLLTLMVNTQSESWEEDNEKLLDQNNLLPEYDFIIVGAGTAGCVLANRLTEISDWNVLIVEAGGDKILTDIPLKITYNQLTPVNWNYKTEPSNRYCTGLTKKQCLWPRGKVIGGSSSINYMAYTRGSPDNYDRWEEMGNDGWGWRDVLPYFKKIENFNIPVHYDSKYHSKNGPVNIEYSLYQSMSGKAWIDAAEELGFQYVDYNNPETPSGVSRFQLSIKNGTHHTSARAYLYPIEHRPNLHISQNSFVTKILFDDTNTIAIGIEMVKYNITHQIFATKEVVVSGGAVNSPQLLMLSGIGPKKHLRSLRIKTIKDLPVGYNLMDHIGTIFHFVKDSDSMSKFTENELMKEWLQYRSGPFAIPIGAEVLLTLNLNDKFNTTLNPDVELIFDLSGFNSDPLSKSIFGIDDNLYEDVFQPLGNSNAFLVFPTLMLPKSKGRLMLQSRNPRLHPKIIPNYYEFEEDLQKVVEILKIAIEISKQPSMKKLGTRIYDVPIKKCLEFGKFGSDGYLACHVRTVSLPFSHSCGTCKMGIKGDSTAVVDPRLKVHGVRGLRVIDASIMPEIVSVHINAATFMIAEKGADMIKEDWKLTQKDHRYFT